MQEVDVILSRFSDVDISEKGKCQVAISGMKSPARETTTTNVQVGSLSNEIYVTFADALFDLYMKSTAAIETNIRIWNLNQKGGEDSTAWGARCFRAMMYRLKKDVAYCARHKNFMKYQEIGLKAEKLEKEYVHATHITQACLESTIQYLSVRADRPPWPLVEIHLSECKYRSFALK